MRPSEQSLELVPVTVFKDARRDLIIIFLFYQAASKIKNHLRMYGIESSDSIGLYFIPNRNKFNG